jgi:carboxyl-terminal processing protease
LYSNVYRAGSRRVGYFVYNQFSGPSSIEELINTLQDFQSQGVNDIILDLRYNRGGYVSTQDTLANMLAPASVGRGQNLMYTYQFNQKYSKSNVKTLWYKTPRIIVTPATASASELLINNLKPVLNVKLVGESNTFGKPVGFFPIPVFQYNIYPVSFKTVNSAGSTDFYQGFPVDKNTVDDLSRDFGDLNESSLKEALSYMNTGAFTAVTQKRLLTTGVIAEEDIFKANNEINKPISKIEIENRPNKMPLEIRLLQIK